MIYLEVMSPQWSDLVLTADVPHGEADVFVLDRLDVESCKKTRMVKASFKVHVFEGLVNDGLIDIDFSPLPFCLPSYRKYSYENSPTIIQICGFKPHLSQLFINQFLF